MYVAVNQITPIQSTPSERMGCRLEAHNLGPDSVLSVADEFNTIFYFMISPDYLLCRAYIIEHTLNITQSRKLHVFSYKKSVVKQFISIDALVPVCYSQDWDIVCIRVLLA